MTKSPKALPLTQEQLDEFRILGERYRSTGLATNWHAKWTTRQVAETAINGGDVDRELAAIDQHVKFVERIEADAHVEKSRFWHLFGWHRPRYVACLVLGAYWSLLPGSQGSLAMLGAFLAMYLVDGVLAFVKRRLVARREHAARAAAVECVKERQMKSAHNALAEEGKA